MILETSYKTHLEAAEKAAHIAADMLRAAFLQHEDVSRQAEAAIGKLLLSCSPDYGYWGRDSHVFRYAQDRLRHVWLVDANDDPEASRAGYRGSSIAISLLRDGHPVLGVVACYAMPDNEGDFFSWADGMGPLKRNGKSLSRKWADAVSARSTLLTPIDFEPNAAALAKNLAPLRFRTMAGPAYRFALAAAGEAEAAIAFEGASPASLAAGLALLQANGADVTDFSGRPVRFSSEGSTDIFCGTVGGPELIVRFLSGRRWEDLQSKTPLVRISPCADSARLSRAQGCLLGQFAGDALGSLVEGESLEQAARNYPNGVTGLEDGGTWATIAGQPTDDSEMTLALARSLTSENGYKDEAVAGAYGRWLLSKPFDCPPTVRGSAGAVAHVLGAAAGPACVKSLAALSRAAADVQSQTNAALMRVSPIGIAGSSNSLQLALYWAKADATLTDPHRLCQDANAILAMAIAQAIHSGDKPRSLHARAVDWCQRLVFDSRISATVQAAGSDPPPDTVRGGNAVLTALHNALYELTHARSVEEGVLNTVARGGDTDTNAAVTGALLGAVWGRKGIPDQWVDRIVTCRPTAGVRGVAHPRPPEYWPTDALQLAERLLGVGKV